MNERTVIPLEEYADGDDVFSEITVTENESRVNPSPEGPDIDAGLEEDIVEQLQVLNEAVAMMIDSDLIDEADGYQFLSGKLAEIVEPR